MRECGRPRVAVISSVARFSPRLPLCASATLETTLTRFKKSNISTRVKN